jgi:hypothetical protein
MQSNESNFFLRNQPQSIIYNTLLLHHNQLYYACNIYSKYSIRNSQQYHKSKIDTYFFVLCFDIITLKLKLIIIMSSSASASASLPTKSNGSGHGSEGTHSLVIMDYCKNRSTYPCPRKNNLTVYESSSHCQKSECCAHSKISKKKTTLTQKSTSSKAGTKKVSKRTTPKGKKSKEKSKYTIKKGTTKTTESKSTTTKSSETKKQPVRWYISKMTKVQK